MSLLTKNQTAFIKSLHKKKGRLENGLFIAEGWKLVQEILDSSLDCKEIYASRNWLEKNHSGKYGFVRFFETDENDLSKISALSTPQEVIAVVKIPEYYINDEQFKKSLSLVLDDISDPGNLGTMIRIADWFGITDIVCSENSADAFSPKVVQASMGSVARVRIHYAELQSFFEKNKNDWQLNVYGASLEGKSIYEMESIDKGLLLMGNESRGINPSLLSFISKHVHIPAYHTPGSSGKAESLNVSVSAALICAAFRKPLQKGAG